jgi:hypothetical protein
MSNHPCKDCISYAICRTKLIDNIERSVKNIGAITASDMTYLIYVASTIILQDQCSIYKRYYYSQYPQPHALYRSVTVAEVIIDEFNLDIERLRKWVVITFLVKTVYPMLYAGLNW